MQIKDIPASSITHLHYAFAYITPNGYEIVTMDDTVPTSLFSQITELKDQNPALKVIVSVGGWSFTDNGTNTQSVFGDIAGNAGNRAKFITNLLDFMQNYGFDGVDFDWVSCSNDVFASLTAKFSQEYPGAADRGGHDDDGVSYTTLLSDLRSVFSGVISFTAPTSYWVRKFHFLVLRRLVAWNHPSRVMRRADSFFLLYH